MSENLIHGALTHQIIGAAMTVLNTLRPGLDEKIYHRLTGRRALKLQIRGTGLATNRPLRSFTVPDPIVLVSPIRGISAIRG